MVVAQIALTSPQWLRTARHQRRTIHRNTAPHTRETHRAASLRGDDVVVDRTDCHVHRVGDVERVGQLPVVEGHIQAVRVGHKAAVVCGACRAREPCAQSHAENSGVTQGFAHQSYHQRQTYTKPRHYTTCSGARAHTLRLTSGGSHQSTGIARWRSPTGSHRSHRRPGRTCRKYRWGCTGS